MFTPPLLLSFLWLCCHCHVLTQAQESPCRPPLAVFSVLLCGESPACLLNPAPSILPLTPYIPTSWSTKKALAHSSLHPVPLTALSYNTENLFIFLPGHAAFLGGLASMLCLIWCPRAGNSLKFLVFGWRLSLAPFPAAGVLLSVCFFHDFSWNWAEEGKVANFSF